jgi:hypothetical protein
VIDPENKAAQRVEVNEALCQQRPAEEQDNLSAAGQNSGCDQGTGRSMAARGGFLRSGWTSTTRDFVQTISRVKFAREFVWTFSLAVLSRPPILQSSLVFMLTSLEL